MGSILTCLRKNWRWGRMRRKPMLKGFYLSPTTLTPRLRLSEGVYSLRLLHELLPKCSTSSVTNIQLGSRGRAPKGGGTCNGGHVTSGSRD